MKFDMQMLNSLELEQVGGGNTLLMANECGMEPLPAIGVANLTEEEKAQLILVFLRSAKKGPRVKIRL